MNKVMTLSFNEKEGRILKNILKDMDIRHPLLAFVEECVEKFNKKMLMKEDLYALEEKPEFLVASFRVEYNEELKDLLLSDETKKMFGKEISEQIEYRLK